MRILLAVDGSSASARAVEFVSTNPWPDPTLVRVVLVDTSQSDLDAAPWLGEPIVERPVPSHALTRHLHDVVVEAQETLLARDIAATAGVLVGRAADEIVAEAERWVADLVVMGSRGHGTIERMLLGSVSAEVVDRAPCPVLVARSGRVGRAVIAVDGSGCSDQAVAFVTTHRLFPDAVTDVISVCPPAVVADGGGLAVGVAMSTIPDCAMREWHAEAVRRAAAELRRDGRLTEAAVASGQPAGTILQAAEGADLIVVGTRGNTGLRRLVLGSTARNVLLHAHTSVLVVRQARRRSGHEERVRRAAPARTPTMAVLAGA